MYLLQSFYVGKWKLNASWIGEISDDLKPFCQVKLDSEVVFKTKIAKSSKPRFDEKVEIQINDPESVLEIVCCF